MKKYVFYQKKGSNNENSSSQNVSFAELKEYFGKKVKSIENQNFERKQQNQ